MRELYRRNSSDVRFLIPVLHGLQKVRAATQYYSTACLEMAFPDPQHEVIAALPKFIKLSPTMVKGVFDRLLVSYKGELPRIVDCMS